MPNRKLIPSLKRHIEMDLINRYSFNEERVEYHDEEADGCKKSMIVVLMTLLTLSVIMALINRLMNRYNEDEKESNSTNR